MQKSRQIYIIILAAFLIGVVFFISTKTKQNLSENSQQKTDENLNVVSQINVTSRIESQESEKSLFLNTDQNYAKKIHRPTRVLSGLPAIAPEDLISEEVLSDTPWKIWSHTESILKSDYEPAQVILSEITNRYIIQSNDENTNLSEFKKSKLVVLYNSRLKKTGLLSGHIKIVTNQKDLLERKLKSLNALIVNSFDSIQTYFVTSQDENFDLLALFNTLKEQSFTKSIELDVIDRSYEKN